MIGTISRWGTRGYGFVTCDGLEAEAWLHAKFLDDPQYEPRQGDRVEFELEKLADGRFQARRVRPLNGARARTGSSRPPSSPALSAASHPGPGSDLSRAYGDGPLAVKLALPPLVLPSGPPSPPPSLSPRLPSLSPPVSSAQPGASDPAVESQAASPPSSSPALASAPPAPEELLGFRLARGRAERRAERNRLAEEAAQVESELARLRERQGQLLAALAADVAPAGEAAEVAAYLAAAIARLEQAHLERRRLREAVDVARQHAIQRSGLPTVQEYEQLRERTREAIAGGDALTLKAFRALERERRMTLRELADACDRLDSAPPVRAHFVAFIGERGPAVLVAPLSARDLRDLEQAPDLDLAAETRGALTDARARGALPPEAMLRIACSFWQAAERACRELTGAEATVEHGQVAGALAVRIGHVDAGLVQLLLDETWACRPGLKRLEIGHGFEVVEGELPAFDPDLLPDEADAAAEPAEVGPPSAARAGAGWLSLPAVARRLRLSLRDLVALLTDRGIPFNDDQIDAGTEDTLRALLGEGAAGEPTAVAGRAGGSEDGLAAPAPDGGLASPRAIASRMLSKLLRDRRVGGRHTRIENAYGHHFSDGEKDLARRVAEWLEKDGILLPKLNEGSHHISINPRRLRDVGQIIEAAWERGADLDLA